MFNFHQQLRQVHFMQGECDMAKISISSLVAEASSVADLSEKDLGVILGGNGHDDDYGCGYGKEKEEKEKEKEKGKGKGCGYGYGYGHGYDCD
jgi:hypothetical protein